MDEPDLRPRRTFAVISHPDAGKSTLTEALALHAAVIAEAGAVHGKGGRKGTVSDWMDMEKARGISITSAALQFAYGDHVVNLVDTPGHADFSEDTYRVLSAVDSAVMLVDAAKGLEPQTLKLFQVCAHRGIPVITVINKWDRPGLDPLELLDSIEKQIGLRPTPLTWPVGEAGDFRGVLDRRTGGFVRYTRTAGGPRSPLTPRPPPPPSPSAGRRPRRATSCSAPTAPTTTRRASWPGAPPRCSSPRRCRTSASPRSWRCSSSWRRRRGPPWRSTTASASPTTTSAPSSSRCSRAWTPPTATASPTPGSARAPSSAAWSSPTPAPVAPSPPSTPRPSSVASAPRSSGPGPATSSAWSTPPRCVSATPSTPARYPPIASFAPEYFSTVSVTDTGRWKQFRKGIEQLDQEGVIQVLRSELRGEHAPVLAAVGPMQFEVVSARMESEYRAPVRLESLDYSIARRVDPEQRDEVAALRGVEVMQRTDGALLALFSDRWSLEAIERMNPHLTLEPLVAGRG